MTDISKMTDLLKSKMETSTEDLLAELLASAGEDFAVPQDRFQAGLRVFNAYVDGIRAKICGSETRALLSHDFERSGPALASLLVADTYLTSLGVAAQLAVGALVLKLGVDRVCAG